MKKLILACMSIAFAVSGSLTINANTDDNYYSSNDLNLQLDYHGYESGGVFYSSFNINNTLAVSRMTTWETVQGNNNDVSRGWYRDGSEILRLDYHQQYGQSMSNLMPIGRYEFSTHAGARYSKISVFGILMDIDAEILTFDVSYPAPNTVRIEWQFQPSQEPYTYSSAVSMSGIDDQGAQIILYDNNVAGNESLDSAYKRGNDAGYYDGYADGDTAGYLRGHTAGMQQNAGIDNLTSNFTTGLTDILSLEIGGLSLGALALIPISIAVFSWFLKLFGKG